MAHEFLHRCGVIAGAEASWSSVFEVVLRSPSLISSFGLPKFASADRPGFVLLGGGDFPPAFRQEAVEVVLGVRAFVDLEGFRVRQDCDVAGVPGITLAHHDVGASRVARQRPNKALERNGRGGVVSAFFHSGELVCFGDVTLSARPSAIAFGMFAKSVS